MALTERLAILIEAKGGAASAREFGRTADAADNLGKKAGGAHGMLGKLGAQAGTAGGLVGKLGSAAGSVGTALGGPVGQGIMAGVAATAALGAAAYSTLNKFIGLADEVDNFQDVSGASAEDASKLVTVVKQLGISPEAAGKAFFKLGKEIGAGTSTLGKYGIEVARNKDGTTDLVGTLSNVGRAYRTSGDAAEKNAIASAAFGKAGGDLVDVLSLTDQQLTELAKHGPVFSQADIDNAKETAIVIRQAKAELEKVQVKGGGILAGVFVNLIEGAEVAKEKLGLAAEGSAAAARSARRAEADVGLLGESFAKTAEQADAEHTALVNLRSGLLGTIDATRSLEKAHNAVSAAEQDVAAKRKALVDLQRSAIVDAKALEQAQRSLASAERGLASAQERQVAAAEAAQRARSYDPNDLADADLARREAVLGVADAQDRLEQAQRDLNDAQAAGDPEAIDDATRGLTSAQLGLERAQRAATAAAKAQNDLNPNSEAGAKRIADADRDLRDANDAVATAYLSVRDASNELAAVQAGDPDRANKIRDAYVALVDAQNRVADAKYGELGAILNLEDARYREAVLLGAGGDAAARLHGELQKLVAIYPQLAPLLAGLLGATGTETTYLPGTGIPSNAPSSVGRRAAGGPVSAGSTYLVGEKGPELLHMGTSGFVVPNSALGGGGGNTYITVHMPPGSDGEDVVAALRRYQQRNGSVPIRAAG